MTEDAVLTQAPDSREVGRTGAAPVIRVVARVVTMPLFVAVICGVVCRAVRPWDRGSSPDTVAVKSRAGSAHCARALSSGLCNSAFPPPKTKTGTLPALRRSRHARV